MTPSVSRLVEAAQAHAQAGRVELATACLDAAQRLCPGDVHAHNLREALRVPGCFSDWVGVCARIHVADDIFRFFASHPQSLNPVRDYLSDGWRSALELHRLANAIGRPLQSLSSFLEFACGHGRLTRHLVHDIKPARLTVSDVVPGTVDFLQDALGVQGFYSALRVQDLCAPSRYDMVFVLSLFTHLPRHTWGEWLAALFALVNDGGCLVISTHGAKCVQDAAVQLDAEGFAFFSQSESSALTSQDYGVTYTSTNFVQNMVTQHVGDTATVTHFPAHFWGNQDAFVIERQPT